MAKASKKHQVNLLLPIPTLVVIMMQKCCGIYSVYGLGGRLCPEFATLRHTRAYYLLRGSLPRDAVTYTELFMLSYTFPRWLTSNTDGRVGYFIKIKGL